ncbi:phage head-tail connector protein [Peribacillus sp. NPDC097198]|uniref:phage head-tail connector protein n=1 Tax=Peribacillus sp. NPDC097198 TaxID=3364397 RepID=UPI0037F98C39
MYLTDTLDAISKLKILLGIEDTNENSDKLELYLSGACDYILNYCRIEAIPIALTSTLLKMAAFDYRAHGLDNVKSETKGRLSESYITDYPPNIMNQLNPYRRIRVI